MRMRTALNEVKRCPHCGVANPMLVRLWMSEGPLRRGTNGPKNIWALYTCTSCGDCISAKGTDGAGQTEPEVMAIFPEPPQVDQTIPDTPRNFLQQAYETLHAPDAAAVMAGSAVDAMLKIHGYVEGSVYKRIEQAVGDHLLTDAMGEWAHSVRLGSNRPRHADNERPHLTAEEAKQSVEFASALAQFLFVLTAKIATGIEKSKKAEEKETSRP